jgi:hypothetical protein
MLPFVIGACSTKTTCTGYPGIDRASCTTTNSGGEWLAQNWQLLVGGFVAVCGLISWASQRSESNKPSTTGSAQPQQQTVMTGTQAIRASDVRPGDLLSGNSQHAGGRVTQVTLLAGGVIQITYDHGRTYAFDPSEQLMRLP